VPYRYSIFLCSKFQHLMSFCVALMKSKMVEPVKYEFDCNWRFGHLASTLLAQTLDYVCA
jgi:hypothetical protein